MESRYHLKNGAKPKSHTSRNKFRIIMPKYVIEREIPNAGKLTSDELQGISQASCGVLKQLGTEIQWVNSYITNNKIYCIYIAPNEEMIYEHAKLGGFPANSVNQILGVIDPTTAEEVLN